ncbi:MAG: hypothetical protein QS748_01360 [Candidatus Endonucleobacter bathymodioli]|nr:hypothetical protein [Candidatus Endonucleobacter bathymodioli]
MNECKKYLGRHYSFQDLNIDNVSGGDVIIMLSKRLSMLEDASLNAHRRNAMLSESV